MCVVSKLQTSGSNPIWATVGVNAVCDTSAGEVYLQESPGKLPNIDACKKSCEGNEKCRSISYFKSGWCSHYSTACTKTRKGKATTLQLETGWFGLIGLDLV